MFVCAVAMHVATAGAYNWQRLLRAHVRAALVAVVVEPRRPVHPQIQRLYVLLLGASDTGRVWPALAHLHVVAKAHTNDLPLVSGCRLQCAGALLQPQLHQRGRRRRTLAADQAVGDARCGRLHLRR